MDVVASGRNNASHLTSEKIGGKIFRGPIPAVLIRGLFMGVSPLRGLTRQKRVNTQISDQFHSKIQQL
jgi:hypothetical protein